MSDPNNHKSTGLPTPTAPPCFVDTESQTPATGVTERQTPVAGTGVGHIIERWKTQDMLKKDSVDLRCIALLFSLLAFIIMASNKHGDRRDFDKYVFDSASYNLIVSLAIAILSTLYTGLLGLIQIHQISTRNIFADEFSFA